jgi:hypothetical protein
MPPRFGPPQPVELEWTPLRISSLTQQSSSFSVWPALAFRGIFAVTAAWRRVMATELDLQKAREVVRKAKRALREAEHRFDTERALDFNSPLIHQIKAAERRLAEARVQLRQIDPRSSE